LVIGNSPYAVPQDLSCLSGQHECCSTKKLRSISW
jgi:hypothetical protein